LIQKKDWEKAIEVLSKVVQSCPMDAGLRLKRSTLYTEMGSKEMAIADLRYEDENTRSVGL
jgi:regulator of sirC expression with transglutaminase-like and TPR domain